MTVAICIRCGGRKTGALTACRGCGFEPQQNEDKAKSMILSDRWIPKEEIDKVSERVRKGEPLDYPEAMVRNYVTAFEQGPAAAGATKLPRRIVWIIALAAIAATLAWMAFR